MNDGVEWMSMAFPLQDHAESKISHDGEFLFAASDCVSHLEGSLGAERSETGIEMTGFAGLASGKESADGSIHVSVEYHPVLGDIGDDVHPVMTVDVIDVSNLNSLLLQSLSLLSVLLLALLLADLIDSIGSLIADSVEGGDECLDLPGLGFDLVDLLLSLLLGEGGEVDRLCLV